MEWNVDCHFPSVTSTFPLPSIVGLMTRSHLHVLLITLLINNVCKYTVSCNMNAVSFITS